ncbi:MAG: PD-(D/E)XK nuclease family protein [Deltaproteobacteria bacterium]|nr:PD-(D/E)XK nuclease family protein [Deltaproteobacteria bacterium]
MERKILSPTSINTYLRCPRKYYLKYIKGLKERPSIYLIRGKAVHDTIVKFHALDQPELSDIGKMKTRILSIFNHTWKGQEGEIQKLGLPGGMLNEFYQESEEMLMGWLKSHIKAAPEGQSKPEIEVKLFSNIYGVMGIIDAIHRQNGKVSLTDYKTSKKDDLTPDIKIQMAIYALLYQDNYGRLPDTVIIHFLKHGTEVPFKVDNKFTDYAVKLCKEIHEKTSSKNEQDYSCQCGGWCEKDFL